MINRSPFLVVTHAARTFAAQDVRQGEIVLKRPWQRAVFILGLAGAVVLAVFLGFAMYG